MAAFLERVLAEKQAELRVRKAACPLSAIDVDAGGPVRDFRAAVGGGGCVIAELKARTPTIESFPHSDSIEALAHVYRENGAAAISIVTDEKNFGTSLATVTRVREEVDLPVLVKDFVVDPYQIVAARAAGADAILLIVRLLDGDALATLHGQAQDLGMSVLVETHSEEEVIEALGAGASIVGVNNRDLDRMEVSLDTTRRLAGLVPDGTIVVAESGIRTRADIDDLAAHGASAFLVGGSLLAADDPGAKLRELTAAD